MKKNCLNKNLCVLPAGAVFRFEMMSTKEVMSGKGLSCQILLGSNRGSQQLDYANLGRINLLRVRPCSQAVIYTICGHCTHYTVIISMQYGQLPLGVPMAQLNRTYCHLSCHRFIALTFSDQLMAVHFVVPCSLETFSSASLRCRNRWHLLLVLKS